MITTDRLLQLFPRAAEIPPGARAAGAIHQRSWLIDGELRGLRQARPCPSRPVMVRTRVQVVPIAVGGSRATAVALGSDMLEPGWAAVGSRRVAAGSPPRLHNGRGGRWRDDGSGGPTGSPMRMCSPSRCRARRRGGARLVGKLIILRLTKSGKCRPQRRSTGTVVTRSGPAQPCVGAGEGDNAAWNGQNRRTIRTVRMQDNVSVRFRRRRRASARSAARWATCVLCMGLTTTRSTRPSRP